MTTGTQSWPTTRPTNVVSRCGASPEEDRYLFRSNEEMYLMKALSVNFTDDACTYIQ